jgi:hypothetical protein
VNKVFKSNHKKKGPKKQQFSSKEIDCKFCGNKHERNKESCPACGKECRKCSRKKHFASKCLAKKGASSSSIGEVTAFAITGKDKITKTLTVKPSGLKVTFLIDTGASINILPIKEYVRLTGDKDGSRLDKTSTTTIRTYGGKTWTSQGRTELAVVVGTNVHNIPIIVVNLNAMPLLSLKTSEVLGLVQIMDCDRVTTASRLQGQISDARSRPSLEQKVRIGQGINGLTKDEMLRRYADVFDGLGELEGEYHIQMDPHIKPVVNPPRPVPVAIREELKNKLDEMEKMGIIKKVTKPTKWVSSLMLKREPNKLRICLDPRHLNEGIMREHYPMPTVEEVTTRLKNAKVFSVVDARFGFWQVKLDEESSELTTFNTPFGRYCWKRMPFGINSAPEIFQRRMHEFAEGLEGVEVIADDFLIYGCGESVETAEINHDENMIKMLEKARKVNLKMNPDKLRYKLKEAKFIGHILTSEGIKVDPSKVEAIEKMPIPEDVTAVKRFLGMVQYLGKFLSKLSDMTKPLRKLTEDEAEWNWTKECQAAFEKTKSTIAKAPLLSYYDVKKEVTIQCDASESGLGGVLLQEGRPVFFTSRAMTQTEQRYAQIEKEMLAIVHSCMKFEQFIYGRDKITVESDHKPLEVIFKKPIADSPKRLQRMLLYLQKFSLSVTYKKGSELYIADTLSRAFLKETGEHKLKDDVFAMEELDFIKEMELVNTIGDIPNSKRRMEEIRTATRKDPVMIKLLKTIQRGWRESKKETDKEIQPYFDVRAELSCEDGLILKGERIVIPMMERRTVMNNLHISHLGREGTLTKAREYVYWPKMNEQIKQMISVCDVCNRVRSQQQKEPLQLQEVPSRAWAVVSSDLFELNNRIYIIVVDHYSNFFEYELLSAATSGLVIRAMKQMFARYGIPEKMITDNGTQYVSDEFKKFSKEYGFDHSTTSPRFPQANGKAERAVGVCKQLMQKSLIAKSDFYVALLDFRNTPQAEIGLSPAQRMFGRRTRSLIPAVSKKFEQQQLPNVKQRIESSRAKQKQYFDEGSKELPELKVGDTVRMRLPGQKTWSKGTVVKKAGVRSFVVRVNGKNYRRNRRQIILTPELPDEEQREDDDGAEPLINEEPNQENNNSPPRQAEPQVHRGVRVSTRERRPPNRYGDWAT